MEKKKKKCSEESDEGYVSRKVHHNTNNNSTTPHTMRDRVAKDAAAQDDVCGDYTQERNFQSGTCIEYGRVFKMLVMMLKVLCCRLDVFIYKNFMDN